MTIRAYQIAYTRSAVKVAHDAHRLDVHDADASVAADDGKEVAVALKGKLVNRALHLQGSQNSSGVEIEELQTAKRQS